jgi:hypothetical protein
MSNSGLYLKYIHTGTGGHDTNHGLFMSSHIAGPQLQGYDGGVLA